MERCDMESTTDTQNAQKMRKKTGKKEEIEATILSPLLMERQMIPLTLFSIRTPLIHSSCCELMKSDCDGMRSL